MSAAFRIGTSRLSKEIVSFPSRELTNEVFAKQVGFEEFQKANKNFEYRIIFNAGIQAEQARLLEEVRSL